MTQRTIALCRQLGAGAGREDILPALAQAACQQLNLRLRPGVTQEDCADVFPLAAAMLVMGTLEELEGESRVNSFTAGEVTIRCSGSGNLARAARQMMQPWTREEGFACRGVRG